MITRMPDGRIRFRVQARGVDRVQLLGTFTDWESSPVDLTPAADGWFAMDLQIEPGDHEFQYLADGERWMADFAAFGVRMNEFGLWVSQLHVEEAVPSKLTIETRPVRPKATPAPGGAVRLPAA